MTRCSKCTQSIDRNLSESFSVASRIICKPCWRDWSMRQDYIWQNWLLGADQKGTVGGFKKP